MPSLEPLEAPRRYFANARHRRKCGTRRVPLSAKFGVSLHYKYCEPARREGRPGARFLRGPRATAAGVLNPWRSPSKWTRTARFTAGRPPVRGPIASAAGSGATVFAMAIPASEARNARLPAFHIGSTWRRNRVSNTFESNCTVAAFATAGRRRHPRSRRHWII